MRTQRRSIATAVAAALALLAAMSSAAPPPAHAGPLGSTTLLTRTSGFGPITAPLVNNSAMRGDDGQVAGRRTVSGQSGASTNRYVVFESLSDGLSSEDDDRFTNIYVRDRVAATTTLVSRADGPAGAGANGDSGDPAISGDGRWVAFESSATNLGVASGGTSQVYVRDLVGQTTALVSRADGPAGAVGNDFSWAPSIDRNGSRVAFSTLATNLGATAAQQVVLRDRSADSTTLVSAADGGMTVGNDDSREPSISADGLVVAFTSDASNLVPDPPENGAHRDVFRRRLAAEGTDLVSRAGGGGVSGNQDSYSASASEDGSRISFVSGATNLIVTDADTQPDVYVHDFGTNGTLLASRTSGGQKADAPATDASISDDGETVAFQTAATNLAGATDTNGQSDVYVRELGAATMTLASRRAPAPPGDGPSAAPSISPLGNRVVFTSRAPALSTLDDDDFAQVHMSVLGFVLAGVDTVPWISRPTGTGAFQSGTNDAGMRLFGRSSDTVNALSEQGRVAAFVSTADELSAADDNRFHNVFARDSSTGETILVSRADGPGGAAGNQASGISGGLGLNSSRLSVSADGRRVAFTSLATNLVPGDANGRPDVFVRDLLTGNTILVSVGSDESQVVAPSGDAMISADGTRVAFVSSGSFDAADANANTDVYVRDLAAGTTTLASRQDGPGGAVGDDDANSPAIDADGTRVAFTTGATNLAPALIDSNGKLDVYVRDLATDDTLIASTANGSISAGAEGSGSPAIDARGTRVAFVSSNLLAPGDVNDAQDVFVRELGTPTVTLASRGTSGFSGTLGAQRPAISADGTRVAFESSSADLVPGDVNGVSDVFLRDTTAGTTQLVSRADGPAGAQTNAEAGNPSISPDGHCIAFDTYADNLIAGPPGTDFQRAYLRAVDADCTLPATSPTGGGRPPAEAPSGTAAADRTAPVISALRLSRKRLRVGPAPTALAAARRTPAGTVLSFRLSEPARVTIAVERLLAGRRSGRRCVAPSARLRRARPCTRAVRAGALVRALPAGAARVAFSGRLGRKALKTGRHRVALTAVDDAGNRSAPRRATLTIVRR